MATHLIKRITSNQPPRLVRLKTTSSQYVSSRVRDATFEKFMDNYKNLLKVISIQDLILANPNNPPTVSVEFLNRLSQKLHLNRGATAFLRKYHRIFDIFFDPNLSQPFCKLTPAAMQISNEESAAIHNTHPLVVDRLTRLLSMSLSKTLPLRAIFKVWRELGLPDDFEDSIISKNLLKVISIQDLILANPNNPPTVSVEFLNRLSQKLHLNRGATAFLRKYHRIFDIFFDPNLSQPFCKLTPAAMQISNEESAAIHNTHPLVVDRLTRLLSMSLSKTLPLRAIFKVWRELGLPDDFEDSIISKNHHLFRILDAHEPGTHLIKLVGTPPSLTSAVENWRVMECCKVECSIDRTEMRYSFKHTYPPCMKLKKNFRAKVKEWQKLSYIGPYEEFTSAKKKSKLGLMEIEKRAVAIVHEFLSLTVEKTVEVEKISHFRKWFGIELNVRDLFLDHPGMFYLSTKGKRHTVFLREAYERGRLIDPNPVYDVRRKLLDLVVLGRRGLRSDDYKLSSSASEEDDLQEMENE